MAEATLLCLPKFILMIFVSVYFCVISVHCAQDVGKLGDFPGYTVIDDGMSINQFAVMYHDDAHSLQSRIKRQSQAQETTTPRSFYTDESSSHQYYNSSFFYEDTKYYIDLDSADSFTVIPHKILSDSHLTAAALTLPFTFSFYGHNVSKAYIATGGFIYLGTFFHEFIAATQYVAPLMGNFDPSLNDSAIIRYAHNDTAFTVEWNSVHVQHNIGAGSFTFQTTLMKDGRIIFAYKRVPTSPTGIGGGNGHKVTVGLSDGFYIDEPLYEGSAVIQRHIYRYHTVELDQQLVVDRSAFVLTPLTTCNQLSSSCAACLGTMLKEFDCGWCNALTTCSSGFDRFRQEWLEAGCDEEKHSDVAHCPIGISAGVVVGILIGIVVLLVIIGFLVWLGYSYTHPLSSSGLFLIEFRHIFKRDSVRNTSDEARFAVSISGDMHGAAEVNDATEKAANGSLADQAPVTLSLPQEKVATCSPDEVVPDIPPIPATASSVVQA